MDRTRPVQLVHQAQFKPSNAPSGQTLVRPRLAVSDIARLEPTPDDRTFEYSKTLRCAECGQEYRIGTLNRKALLRAHRANIRLWLYAGNSLVIIGLLTWVGVAPALVRDVSAGDPVAIGALVIFLLICAIPTMVVFPDMLALRRTIVHAETNKEVEPGDPHSWIWEDPRP